MFVKMMVTKVNPGFSWIKNELNVNLLHRIIWIKDPTILSKG